MPELLSIATTFAKWGGAFRVATREGRVVASIGYARSHDHEGWIELKKLYVYAAERGPSGPALPLLNWVVSEADRIDAKGIELWSDTRFVRAHAFYEKHGFHRTGERRELFDKSDTVEYRFLRLR